MKTAPILLLLVAALCLVSSAHAAIPALPEIPTTLPDAISEPLIAKRTPLVLKRQALIAEGEANTRQCAKIIQGSAEHQACLSKLSQFNARVEALRRERDRLADEVDSAIVAEKQAQALSCATSELQELANGMGEEGAPLRAELKGFLDDVRVELSKPCSGQPKTHNIQTISLSGLTKDAKKKEDHLEENVLVTRDEETCEVRLNVQHASSLKSASSSRSPGQPFNEGQSVIRMDKTGNILIAETPAGVEKCLARLSTKGQ